MPCLGLPLEQAVRGASELWAATGAPGQEATNPLENFFGIGRVCLSSKLPHANPFVASVPQPPPQHAGA